MASAAEEAWTGQLATAEMDDSAGQRVTATVTVDRATRLGCGCFRLEAARPGPDPTSRVHLLTGCARHY
jgi:hypothetical protein